MLTACAFRKQVENLVTDWQDCIRDNEFFITAHIATPAGNAFYSTAGYNLNNKPDMVVGINIGNDVCKTMAYMVEMYQAYFQDMGEVITDKFDRDDFELFIHESIGDWEQSNHVFNLFNATPHRLVELDPDTWFMGEGIGHRYFYNADTRKKARFIQMVFSDAKGLWPEDEGYDCVQRIFKPLKRNPLTLV